MSTFCSHWPLYFITDPSVINKNKQQNENEEKTRAIAVTVRNAFDVVIVIASQRNAYARIVSIPEFLHSDSVGGRNYGRWFIVHINEMTKGVLNNGFIVSTPKTVPAQRK